MHTYVHITYIHRDKVVQYTYILLIIYERSVDVSSKFYYYLLTLPIIM